MSHDIHSYDVLGIPISITTLASAQAKIEQWASDNMGRFVCVRDVSSLMVMIADPELIAMHKEAALVTPDGMPLALIGKLRVSYPPKFGH